MTHKDKNPRAEHTASGRDARKTAEARGHETAPLTYRRDPAYRKVLEHFQSAEWEACLHGIDRLLKAHPGDKHLLAFKQEVKRRAETQQLSEQQRSAEESERKRQAARRRVMAGLAGVVILLTAIWFYTSVRAEETRMRLSAEATRTAADLASKRENADTFLKAGRPAEALALYKAIQMVDPAYDGIEDAVQTAQAAVETEELYQQAGQAAEAGDPEEALRLLTEVQERQADYKDTTQLIAKVSQEQKIAVLLEEIEDAYQRGDSQSVVDKYEEIRTIDASIELPDLEDELFASYQDLVFESARRPDLSPEEIHAAVGYYRKALALFPTSREYARQREELQEVAIDLLASQYYLQGIDMLESSDYSLQGIGEATLVLQRARERAPGSRLVEGTLEKAEDFIAGYEHLINGAWGEAITKLEFVYRREPSFAEGRVRYFLYEAYTAQGDILMQDADYGGALNEYQKAERLAWAEEENVLRLFQIETRIAVALRRLGNPDEGAEFYHFAFGQLHYEDRLKAPEHAALLETLRNADAADDLGTSLAAIELYEQAMDQLEVFYKLTRVDALRGDTLPNIAFEFGSTLASLRDANDLGETMVLGRSRELFVPVVPALQP